MLRAILGWPSFADRCRYYALQLCLHGLTLPATAPLHAALLGEHWRAESPLLRQAEEQAQQGRRFVCAGGRPRQWRWRGNWLDMMATTAEEVGIHSIGSRASLVERALNLPGLTSLRYHLRDRCDVDVRRRLAAGLAAHTSLDVPLRECIPTSLERARILDLRDPGLRRGLTLARCGYHAVLGLSREAREVHPDDEDDAPGPCPLCQERRGGTVTHIVRDCRALERQRISAVAEVRRLADGTHLAGELPWLGGDAASRAFWFRFAMVAAPPPSADAAAVGGLTRLPPAMQLDGPLEVRAPPPRPGAPEVAWRRYREKLRWAALRQRMYTRMARFTVQALNKARLGLAIWREAADSGRSYGLQRAFQ